jgi:hypothetical protein
MRGRQSADACGASFGAREGGVRAMSGETCLHCEINEVVRKHIERDDPINLPDLVAKVGESLVELILLGPEEEWGNLLAEAIRDIGQVFLEKSDVVQSDRAH